MSNIKRAHEQTTAAVRSGWVEGGSFFGSIMAGTLLGWLADRVFHTDPWFIVIGIILGSVAGFYRMWALLGAASGEQEPRGG